jgi:hypothetical protein
VGGWGKDIVRNGGFEHNSCNSHKWCVWKAGFGNDPVPGWIANPEIEVGRGNIYNANLGTSWVSDLDSKRNTCIRQHV